MSKRMRKWSVLHPEWEVRKAVNRDRLTGGPIARLADRLTAPLENAMELWDPGLAIEGLQCRLEYPFEQFIAGLFKRLDEYDERLNEPIVLDIAATGT